MPSYKNFRNDFRRNAEGEDLFKIPQRSLTKKSFSDDRKDKIIDWCTFYRRNVHLFIKHYFGIQLYPYQVLWVYWLFLCDSFVSICSRSIGKTWVLSVVSCAKAVLYPNSEVVVVSSTKAQAGILIEKIVNLRSNHPNLAREINNIVTNMNKWEVTFHNGSTIRVVASRDSSRGRRSTLNIYEEFRLIDKEVLDSVIRPFAYVRQAPYLKDPNYQHLAEEPKEVFISSAYHKGLWWFEETKKNIKSMLEGENTGFISIDIVSAIKHNIKTIKSIRKDVSKMDEITALEEVFNIPWGESANSYFKLKMFNRARNIKKAFYPQRIETYNARKNPYGIIKSEGEIRLLSCDVAQRAGRMNDLSVSSCLRLLPTHKGYFIELVYMESFSGVDSISQSLRIKQLFYDFEADVLVLDVGAGGGGLPMYDMLGQISKDAERGIEYPAMTVMANPAIDNSTYEELFKRTLGVNAVANIFPISATAKSNSIMAIQMRDKLQKKMFGFLVDETSAEDYLIRSSYNKEFLDQDDSSAKSWFLVPFVQTSLLINECINLSMTMSSGNLKLTEIPGSRKDRFSSLVYGTYYASIIDQDLLREDDGDEFSYIADLVQSV